MASLLFLTAVSCSSDQRDVGPDAHPPSAATPSPSVASTDTVAGVPSFVWADPALKGMAASQGITSPEAAARAQLRLYAPLYRMAATDVDNLRLRDLQDTGRGPIIARFTREVDGVPVWNETVSVELDRNLDAVALTGFVTGDAPAAMKLRSGAAAGFALAPTRAAAMALSSAAGTAIDASSMSAPRAAEGGYQEFTTAAAVAPVRMKKTWFRTPDRALVDAYYLEMDLGPDASGAPRYYAYVVSASDGKVLFKNDLTAFDHPVTYRVWADTTPGQLPIPQDGPQGNAATPLPGGLANGFNTPFLAPSAITISSLVGVGVLDPWLPPGAAETLGNNVDAYADIANPDGFTPGSDFRADVTAADTFDRVLDTTLDANASVNQQKAGITQLFYNVNFWHDWYYAGGFDEASGNAQAVNFGRGGVQGDSIRGEAQDSSGKNNANMSTPADGGRPRMQMFLWDFGTASINVTSPTPTTFGTVGTASGWSSGNFNLPGNTPIVRAVPADGCTALTGTYTGQIVLIDRGTCGFSVKGGTAQAAGAAGVIIANVASSGSPTVAPNMALTAGQTPPTLPALSLNLADGNTLRTAVAAGPVTGGMQRTTALRDGDIDNQVMAHEWGHYISNRLVFDANGLGTNMARGLGEGWADTHAMLMTVRPGDDAEPTNATWNGVYSVSGYAAGSISRGNPYYFGIRRYPYSTDMTKNPMTFKHIADGNALPVGPAVNANSSANSEVHNTGEVWATMLWECYAALLRDTQGATPRLSFAQARDRWRDYLVAAYKLTPANPTLLEARDALLAVALATDHADYVLFTAAFAKRGAGVFAVGPDRAAVDNNPVVEDYSVGAAMIASAATIADDIAPACNADGVLDNGETGTLTVTFKNVGNAALPATVATVSSTTAGISFPNGATISIPAAAQFQTVTATVRVAAAGLPTGPTLYNITVAVPDNGGGTPPPASFTMRGNYDVATNASTTDDVESPTTAWQVINNPTTLGSSEQWHRVALAANDHRWNGPSSSQASTADLVSPAMFVLPGAPFSITFSHRFSFESPVFDGGVIEISTDNGATWTDVGAAAGYNGTLGNASGNPIGGRAAFVNNSTGYPAFATKTIDLGTTYSGKLVYVRFRVGSDAGTSSPGWDIDNIQVAGVSAPPFDALVAQSTTCNNTPIANAGLGQAVTELTASPVFGPVTVTLDGSASFDADGDVLTYQWVQTGGPAVTLSNANARLPTFTAPSVPRTPSPTTLSFQLVVNDGHGASAPSATVVTVANTNRPPTAVAGPAQTVPERTLVTLDGSGSSDPDSDDTLTYAWTQTAGPTVTLSSTTTAKPTFTGPDVAANTALTFSLVVNDGLKASTASTVTITLTDANQAPTAIAGAAQTVDEFTAGPAFDPVTVTLAATGTDPDNNTLTFTWTQTGGPAVTLSDANAAQPTFATPVVPRAGTTVLTFAVVASDGALTSAPSTTTVTITNVNRPPVAGAGTAQSVDERTVVTLDGTTSADPDTDDALTYAWTQTAGPSVTLAAADTAHPTFTAPDVTADTDLTFALVVNDGLDASPAAEVTVTVGNANRAPVADAGPAQTVVERTLVTLAGGGTDPDGDTLRYQWTAPAGVTLSDATVAAPTFTAPDVANDTSFAFSLVVADPQLATSTPSTVTITVTNANRAPVANAGTDFSVRSGQVVALMGSATDPDGDTHFAWQWTAPLGVTLSSLTSATPTFTAPAVTSDTPLVFNLVVTDSQGLASVASTVTVTVGYALHTPVADAGAAIITPPSAAVALDGSHSSDPDGRALTYAWVQTGGPTVALTGDTTAAPTFTAPAVTADTALTFQLVVTNSDAVASAPATVSVFVRVPPPEEPPPAGDTGCGCNTAGDRSPLGQLAMIGVPLALVLRRRRR
ncbi:MAG: myxosortase-dependent M36 family metallopeptidase [Deltaproteobacteria bacterium]|nr:myxosortase-dependent M36 family metallopeptidase [Deltaproteobacteria bacterium]